MESLTRSQEREMKGLYDGGVDGFVIETQIATEETLLALKVAKENFDVLNIVQN